MGLLPTYIYRIDTLDEEDYHTANLPGGQPL